MRINRRIAQLYPDISRRKADELLANGLVLLNGNVANVGDKVYESDEIVIEGYEQRLAGSDMTVLLHKPEGYVVSRRRQGEDPTVYELLPSEMQHLNYAGRLDNDSRGLLLLTSDGTLLHKLTHPSFSKDKVYLVRTDKPIGLNDLASLNEGVYLEDGLSRLEIAVTEDKSETMEPTTHNLYRITMREGRNRQIRRTLSSLGYEVTDLLRLRFGDYRLGQLKAGEYRIIDR